MSAWKILIIGTLACICLALTMATIAIPMAMEGGERWVWLGGLVGSLACFGTLLVLFMRYADHSFDKKPRGLRA